MAKKDHIAAAERKIGITAYKLYALGALFAGLYIYFFSVPWTLEYLEEIEHVGKTPPVNQETVTPDNSQSVEERAKSLYPYPEKPAYLLENFEPQVTDPKVLIEFQQNIFAWEKGTGNNFLKDHKSMQPANKTTFDYIERMHIDTETGKSIAVKGSMKIKTIEPIRTMEEINSNRPQLYEIDYNRTISQFFYYDRKRGGADWGRDEISKDFVTKYSGNGLCYSKPRDINKKDNTYKNYTTYLNFSIPHI